ncbi:YbaY family lipoprotein [Vibrio metoecus]|uniref:YbaY family lipoprotein n=1 Tax=Vibrio metoecus TaxID=1481663 RepID=UPI00215CB0AE|nr:YbaY family lipoprotein [Vibrio metoecus]MCR9385517.1 YbaY family lipoprotein [Vibrio metoecus]
MKKVLLVVISVLFGSLLVGCQMNESAPKEQDKIQSITGSVAYRERIALPDNAVVTVYLQDVSLADAPATVIAKQNFITNGMQVPLEFNLAYDSSRIKASHRYSVSARIEVDGKLRFITDTHYGVITDTDATKQVRMMLVGVQGE